MWDLILSVPDHCLPFYFGSPLTARSVYGDLTCSVHIVNNFHCFVIIKRMYVFVSEEHMLDWHSCQLCYPLEIKLLLTDGGR